MRRYPGIAAVTGVTLALASIATPALMDAAEAATVSIDPLEGALDFNAFIEGNTYLDNTEMEGPLATGGDLGVVGYYNISLHSAGTFVDGADARPSALVVGGGIDFTDPLPWGQTNILADGYVKVGDLSGTDILDTDQNNAAVNTQLVPAGTAYNTIPRVELRVRQPAASIGPKDLIDFGAAFTVFRENADALASCPATVPMHDANGQVVEKGEVSGQQQIRVTLEAGRTNVLEVTGEDLNNMGDLVFPTVLPSASTPLLINVDTSGTGGDFSWTTAPQSPISGDQAPYMLWNFGTGTTALTLAAGDTVEGSIYAPNASFLDVSPTNVEGQIIAAEARFGDLNLAGGGGVGGETHYFPFAATLTCETEVDPTPSTEPPTTEAPTTDEPTSPCPSEEQTSDEPSTEAPTTDEPTTEEPTTDGPTTDEPTTDEPTTDEPTTDQPTTDEPTTDEPTTDQPTTDEPTTGGPTTDEPTTAGPTSAGPTTGEPVTDEPTTAGGTCGSTTEPPSLSVTGRPLTPLVMFAAIVTAAGAVALIAAGMRRARG
ncbi:choice-of-anchor A family protein [Glycomyces paridis]|uniref:Choice-of-anchor A family protein n=1 Tax=Glycomyces paridis TaxID=2126555 RepID=A0A4S8PHW1_9ACTN|nr:choice-of-anchor A family protein [Glycomyces paridis]THV30187.1 choice-of-anchor A family protein [Glycomyces paridis]